MVRKCLNLDGKCAAAAPLTAETSQRGDASPGEGLQVCLTGRDFCRQSLLFFLVNNTLPVTQSVTLGIIFANWVNSGLFH